MLQEKFGERVCIGYSDHVRPEDDGTVPALEMASLFGVRVIEKHFTDDTGRTGPDHGFSMDGRTWREMVDRTRELENALGTALTTDQAQNQSLIESAFASNGLRLVHGESDGLPGLVVDRYGDTLVAQFGAAGVERWKDAIADALLELTGCTRLYERSDASSRALEGLPVPRLCPTQQGANDVLLPEGHLMRVLTWLDGVPLHQTRASRAQSAALARMAAGLTRALAGFADPAADHVLQWDIKRAADLRPLLPHVADAVPSGSVGCFKAIQALMPPTRSWTLVRPASASKLAPIAER